MDIHAQASGGGKQWIAKEQHFHNYPPTPKEIVGIPHNLPYSGVTQFVGRQAELERLHQQMQRGTTVAISAISGMGGVGKTELALQYAYHHLKAETYSGGICWLRAREELGRQIVSFAQSSLNQSLPADLELAEKVAYCWRHWREGTVLLVLDDVQDYEAIQPFLPPAEPRFRVLLTTRLTLGSPVQNLELKVLTEAEVLDLLRSLVTEKRINQQIDEAKQVCNWLGYLPLGIELIGRYLFLEPDLSLDEMLVRLHQEGLQQEALLRDENAPMWTSTAEKGVAAAFELSWQKLEVAAQQLGGVLSLFALAPIPWELVEKTLSKVNDIQQHPQWKWQQWQQKFWQKSRSSQLKFALNSAAAIEKARRSLQDLHLLQPSGEQMYELHSLLREFFAVKREQMVAVSWQRAFCQIMVAEGNQISQPITLDVMERMTPAMPHLQEAATVLKDCLNKAELTELPNKIGWFYEGQFAFTAAELWYQRDLSIAEAHLGAENLAVAVSLNNLGALYAKQGRYSDAEPLYIRSLNIRERLGVNHPDVANSLNNLAGLYQQQGRYDKAEPLYRRSLSIYYKRLSWYKALNFAHGLNNVASDELLKTDLNVALTLNNLAVLYQAKEDYSQAEQLCLQSLNIRERHLDAKHPTIAESLITLASIYQAKGDDSKVEKLFKLSLSIFEQQFGDDHPKVALNLNNLAGFYDSQKRYNEAEPLYTRARDIWERRLGADHPDVANSLINLAHIYREQRHYEKVEPLYLQALTIQVNCLGEDHPTTQASQQKFLGFLDQVIQVKKTAMLSKHPMTQYLLQNLLQQRRQGIEKTKQPKRKKPRK